MPEIIFSENADAEHLMARDQALLHDLGAFPRPILHFYTWSQPAATYGYFLDPYRYLIKNGIDRRGIQLARRPTGGGILFHHCDLAFSVLIPSTHPGISLNTLSNYALVNNAVSEAVRMFIGERPALLLEEEPQPDANCSSFCMAKPTKYDVMLGGKKVGGAAQRRTKDGLLHQGSIALGIPSREFLEEVLVPGTCIAEAMKRNSFPLLGEQYSAAQLGEARLHMQALLTSALKRAVGD